MALDATAGGSSSNAYCTVAEADSFLSDRSDTKQWETFGDQTKSELLLDAAEILDHLDWLGVPETTTQSMQFPRNGIADRFGNDIDGIPDDVKKAQAILALLTGANEYSDGGSRVASINVDGVAINNPTVIGLPVKVKRLISHLYTDRTYMAKVRRT